jgi:hypothetical protein
MSAEAHEPPGSCGECVMCCEWLDIETEGLSKKAGALCEHCTGGGCGIYQTRPVLCRTFFCGWRLIPQLGPDWRPDRSGVMILLVTSPPPQFTGAQTGFNFVVLGGDATILKPGFAEYVSQLVSRQVAVYLSADSPKTLINEYLAPLVAARDMAGVARMLIHIYHLHLEARQTGLVPRPAPEPG